MIFINVNKAIVMPYTRYIDNGRVNPEDYVPALRSMIDKVYNGDAISVTKHNEEGAIVGYVSEQHKYIYYPHACLPNGNSVDDITNYTCRFGYKNGHPCMFITFTNIEPDLGQGYILCLELENFAKTKYGKCQCINVFESNNAECVLNIDNRGVTWHGMEDIKIGVEYCIYIVAADYAWRHHMYKWSVTKYPSGSVNRNQPNFPDDWEVRLRIRPTIRKYDGKQYCYFQRSLKEFTWVKYPLSTEYGR